MKCVAKFSKRREPGLVDQFSADPHETREANVNPSERTFAKTLQLLDGQATTSEQDGGRQRTAQEFQRRVLGTQTRSGVQAPVLPADNSVVRACSTAGLIQ